MEGSPATPSEDARQASAQRFQANLRRGIRFVQIAMVLYVIETLVGVASFGYAPFVHFLWSLTPTGPYVIPVVMTANGILLGFAGIGLGHLEEVSQELSPETERRLLRSRFSLLLGLAVCLELLPTWLVVLMSPVGGVYQPIVDMALEWGLGLLIVGLAVVAFDVLRRREVAAFPGGRRTAILVVLLMAAFTLAVPLIAIVADGTWPVAAFHPDLDSPGLRASAVLGGAEACFILLAGVAGPAWALTAPQGRKHVVRGFWAGVAAILIEVTLAVVLWPQVISPWFVAPVQGLPPVAWGAPAILLVVVSVRELALAYGRIGIDAPLAPVRLPAAGRPPWWTPYVLPESQVRADSLNVGSNLFVGALGFFVVLVALTTADYFTPYFGGNGGFWGPYGSISLLAPIALAVLLGISLSMINHAVVHADPSIRRRILLARASFFLGIGAVLQLVPIIFVSIVGWRFGPSKGDVISASWWALGLSLPFVLGGVVPAERILLRRSPAPRAVWAPILLAAAAAVAIALPFVSILVTASWPPPPTFYSGMPPGVFVFSIGAETEAALAMLTAAALPARALAPASAQSSVKLAIGLGLAAVVATTAVTVLLALTPVVVSPGALTLVYLFVLAFPAFPWFSWGLVPLALEMSSALLLLVAYRAARVPIKLQPAIRAAASGPNGPA